jgi:hypothetical protein
MNMKRKAATTTERTTVSTTTLTTLEERVVRMRHGLAAPETMTLGHQGAGNPALTAQLEAIERRAIEAAGVRGNSTKSKIVNALRQKNR